MLVNLENVVYLIILHLHDRETVLYDVINGIISGRTAAIKSMEGLETLYYTNPDEPT